MGTRDIIVVGASAGGVEALSRLAAGLPPDLPAAVFVVLHVPPYATSVMPRILSRAGPLPALHARDGEPIRHGRIYVAPPDYHLLISDGVVHLSHGPRENGHRPAIDPLFRSAAAAYGPRVVGVVLTGSLDDGTAGLAVIKQRGGVAVAQDPEDALYPSMPASAIENVAVDEVLPLEQIPPLLVRLAREPVMEEAAPPPDPVMMEDEIVKLDMDAVESTDWRGEPAEFACPSCGGALWEPDGEPLQYRCRVGHAWSPDSLLVGQKANLEDALWMALRAIEEQRALSERLAERARRRGQKRAAVRFAEQATGAQRRAALIREVLLGTNLAEAAEQAAAAKDFPEENV